MNFKEICDRELKESEGLKNLLKKLEDVKGKRVLLFGHDDPDGTSSTSIIKRVLEKKGASFVHTVFPEGFDVFPYEIEAESKYGPFDLFVSVDKGSKDGLDKIVEMGLDTLAIDHHFLMGEIKKATLFNSLLTKRSYCSGSYLCLIVSTLLGCVEPIDEFDALIGLKADFAIDPTSGNFGGADFVKPWIEEIKPRWENLFKEIPGTATLFDTAQREKTTLLSQIAEVYFAVTGGAFQYFYPDDPILGKLNQPLLCFEENLKLNTKIDKLKKVNSLEDFMKLIDKREAWQRAYDLFKRNWSDVVKKMETAVPIGRANDATIYLFVSDKLPLIPMVGGIALAEKVKKNADGEGMIFMINTEITSQGKLGTHFSLRATSDKIHVGKICQASAARLNEVFNNPTEISGGGHPRAGECRTRNAGVPHGIALYHGISLLRELLELEAKRSSWTDSDKKRAVELGIAS